MRTGATEHALPEDADKPERIEWSGDFITAKTRGKWEYVSRSRGIRAAMIVPLTDDGGVVLVEQYRVALGCRCLEFPAGLIGDEDGGADEEPATAAARELEEETGYSAARWQVLGEFCSSPGLTSEGFTLLKATGLTRTGPGGGTDSEDIVVHEVPLESFADAIARFRARGVAIDGRLLLLLGTAIAGDAT